MISLYYGLQDYLGRRPVCADLHVDVTGPAVDIFRAICKDLSIPLGGRGDRHGITPQGTAPEFLRRCAAAALGVQVSDVLREHLKNAEILEDRFRSVVQTRLDAFRENHNGPSLYPYQEDGVRYLMRDRHNLLADDMGLGKTAQLLAALPPKDAKPSVLVVCPASVRSVWETQTRMFRPDLKVIMRPAGKREFVFPEPGELVIVSYNSLPPLYKKEAPQNIHLIGDEAHMLKSLYSMRSESFDLLATKVDNARGHIWLATGTPLLNRPAELERLLRLCRKFDLGFSSRDDYLRLFGARKEGNSTIWGEPLPEVAERLRRIMLRRRRVDVLPQLPTKTHTDIVVPFDVALKSEVLDRPLREWRNRDVLPAFEEMAKARELLAFSKIPAMLEQVESYENQGEPLVVSSCHRAPVEALRGRPGWAVLVGETPEEERNAAVAAFQAGKLRGLAGTMGVIGVGIDLTRGAYLLQVDLSWTPELNAQQEARLLRLGQTRGVFVTRLIADHALDRRVAEILIAKQKLLDASVERATPMPAPTAAPVPIVELMTRLGALCKEQETARNEEMAAEVKSGIKDWDGRPLLFRANRRTVANAVEELSTNKLIVLAHHTVAERFRSEDMKIGHSLVKQMPYLTNKQWAAVRKVAAHYPDVIQPMPVPQ